MNKNTKDPAFLLKPGEIHVWLFDLSDPAENIPAWEKLLSQEETGRAAAYRFERDRRRFVARRGILRQLLGRYTDVQPAEIAYQTNPFGKLSVPGRQVFFNLSGSQDWAAFVFARGQEVGIDLEQVRPLPETARMAEHWFSPEERAGMAALPPELQLEAFYHVWTQKEAFLKARGEGLSRSLQDFSVSVDPGLPGGLLSIRAGAEAVSEWKMVTRLPAEGWRMAVCTRAEAETDMLWFKPDLADFFVRVASG